MSTHTIIATPCSAQAELPPTPVRYETIVAMLRQILDRLAVVETDVDAIDRTMRPFGDGTRIRETRRRS
jgi:hypothetical protein